jgi:hypothetical protein
MVTWLSLACQGLAAHAGVSQRYDHQADRRCRPAGAPAAISRWQREKRRVGKLSLGGRRRHAPEEVQLMCDEYQRSRLDLGVALGDPVCQAERI